MHDVLDLPVFRIVHDPLVHLVEVVVIPLDIALGVGDPGKGEVVVGGSGIAGPAGIVAGFAVGGGVQIRQSGIGGTLDHNGGFAAGNMVLYREGSFRNSTAGIGGGDLFPCASEAVANEHMGCIGIVLTGGGAAPAYHNLILFGSVGNIDGILNVGDDAAGLIGLDRSGIDWLCFVEGGGGISAALGGQVQVRAVVGDMVGTCAAEGYGEVFNLEFGRGGGNVAGGILGGDGEYVGTHAQGISGGCVGGMDFLAVETNLKAGNFGNISDLGI